MPPLVELVVVISAAFDPLARLYLTRRACNGADDVLDGAHRWKRAIDLAQPLAKQQQVVMCIVETGQHCCSAEIDPPVRRGRIIGGLAQPLHAAVADAQRAGVRLGRVHGQDGRVCEQQVEWHPISP